MDQWLSQNTKTWNTAVKPVPNRWLCANSTIMPSLTHRHKHSQKKLHWIVLLNCSIRSTVLANYCALSSSFSCATCWHDCQLTKKERHFGRDTRFPLGPEAVPARHYCRIRSQRSWRKAWRHYLYISEETQSSELWQSRGTVCWCFFVVVFWTRTDNHHRLYGISWLTNQITHTFLLKLKSFRRQP